MSVRAAVPGIKHKRLPIVSDRHIELPQSAMGVAEVVLQIGIARVTQRSRRERRDGAAPVAHGEGLLAGGKVGSSGAQSALSAMEPMEVQIGQFSGPIEAMRGAA